MSKLIWILLWEAWDKEIKLIPPTEWQNNVVIDMKMCENDVGCVKASGSPTSLRPSMSGPRHLACPHRYDESDRNRYEGKQIER